ncbi:type II secretion system F family protein [Vibrio natriegens]|uniref:Type II secretion system protein F n=1 Tax=Vibrio natriegens NBRC 15636 = ATCC 14048 = DSM 759 TaxID=1219067 RepID=A0AAN0Y4K3_VIBNA|nr:type II secretion system F family protein [Vibrio natriegens]ALR14676.1 type II secretion system protein F [Vibrio natriegens NBRC 15636 = ATCC 14048 = DSM 759]ANQ13458.1 type II secretion system protein F [Vibrio natriegens NBRC 15636 = ATCC 14048 = DSM 759]EPM41350.1 type II secretion system protein F [Vibrio natriegens NBRC 15636 = ATCC 14048 = DSM 759]MDX6027901.1 type II secretion system F family protein [Vibrio natriegens NBRC 15636 = ATCC 14048 = DSM 759]UUI11202.1 type II secretion 
MKTTTPQLKNFRWKGINSSGKKTSGQTLAMSEVEVRERLSAQHIKIKKLKKSSISFITKLSHRVKGKDITVFTRQISTMLVTGVPLVQALKLVSNNHKKAEMKSILMSVTRAVEAGTPMSKAMRTASAHFDALYTDLISTGELSGNLAEVFERLATYREKSEELRAKVIKALIYPAMVMLVALGVSYLMLTQVIPEFEKMFSGFGADLPWFTRQVLDLSAWMQNWGSFIALGALSLIISARILVKRSDSFRLMMDRAILRIPVLGAVLSKAAIAKFSRTLATSFSAGIPILTSLKTTSKTSGNLHYQLAVEEVYRDTAAGMPMYVAMRNCDVFPELVLQMVMIGEESGRLDEMLNKVATIYEFEVDNTVDNLSKILEPLIIVFLGVVVGGLVTAMYLPIFNLMSVLG